MQLINVMHTPKSNPNLYISNKKEASFYLNKSCSFCLKKKKKKEMKGEKSLFTNWENDNTMLYWITVYGCSSF